MSYSRNPCRFHPERTGAWHFTGSRVLRCGREIDSVQANVMSRHGILYSKYHDRYKDCCNEVLHQRRQAGLNPKYSKEKKKFIAKGQGRGSVG